ncbi:MAG: putative toxin-antitoxin system toxin component, PIN family [Nitrospira sp. CR1.1]|nr:putative toxin-antitoxin system toxin component, PIN family [Nitrospira sp. CR1.1]
MVVWSASSAAPAANWASPPNRLPLRLQRFGASVRVVLDTNIFVSGLLSAAGPPARILQAVLQRRLIPVMSPDTFAELSEHSPHDYINLRGAYKPN